MARGQAAKLRRRTNRQQKGADPFDENNEKEDDDTPMPPRMSNAVSREKPIVETVDSDDSDAEEEVMPVKKSKNKNLKSPASANGNVEKGGIKRGPLILMILLFGTTVLPALIYLSDYLGKYASVVNILAQAGFALGIGNVPRQRVTSFYEKHAPEKLHEVPTILRNHYGQYPTLVKKLERKYQDYGYFLGWEDDEAPLTIALGKVRETYDYWLEHYWNRYAPQLIKTYVRNARYNISTLYKKLRRAWKKYVWPLLEPVLGVPDARTAERQKRKDTADARKARPRTSSGTRRKSNEFRDDEE